MSNIIEAIKRIERLRCRTRNQDIIWVCDELERRLLGEQGAPLPGDVAAAVSPQLQAAFDKRGYQRDLMRRRRAAAKGVKVS